MLSERLFYCAVALMSIILTPNTNFRAPHCTTQSAATQRRQSVSQSVPHCSAAITVAVSAVLVLAMMMLTFLVSVNIWDPHAHANMAT